MEIIHSDLDNSVQSESADLNETVAMSNVASLTLALTSSTPIYTV